MRRKLASLVTAAMTRLAAKDLFATGIGSDSSNPTTLTGTRAANCSHCSAYSECITGKPRDEYEKPSSSFTFLLVSRGEA
jgi:hypothetical protein